MTVAELHGRMTSREFSEWIAYYAIEPFGEWRADLRMGIQTAALVQPHLRKGKTATAKDFMATFTREQRDADLSEKIKTQLAGRTFRPRGAKP